MYNLLFPEGREVSQGQAPYLRFFGESENTQHGDGV